MFKLYQFIANSVQARINCQKADNNTWEKRHKERADALVREYLPSGSGFDAGTTLDWDKSTGEHLVFNTSFHHMDENGGYDCWTEHMVTITPSLVYGFRIRVSGRDRNEIELYIAEEFNRALDEEMSNEAYRDFCDTRII